MLREGKEPVSVSTASSIIEARGIVQPEPEKDCIAGLKISSIIETGAFAQPLAGMKIGRDLVKRTLEEWKDMDVVEGELKWQAMSHIASSIDFLLQGVGVRFGLVRTQKDGLKFLQKYDYKSLGQLMGVYLMKQTGKNCFRICKKCGDYFVPRRKNQIYCSRRCKNAKNQETYRNKTSE